MKTRVETIEILIKVEKAKGYAHKHVEIERFNPSTHVWKWNTYRPGLQSLARVLKVIDFK